eukprot:jgi/Botrbrau1/19396/Bobra.0338s0025.3
MVAVEDVKKLKVQELRDELAARGLDKSGNKPVLVERLENAVALEEKNKQGAATLTSTKNVSETSSVAAGKEGAPISKHMPIQAPATDQAPTLANESATAEADKLKARAERFGTVSEEDKKRKRAERFGITKGDEPPASAPTQKTTTGIIKANLTEEEKNDEEEKRKKRALRFGLPIVETKEEQLNKLQERAQRFGISTPEIEAAKKAARSARFNVAAKVGPLFTGFM